jgi:cytochrome P450
LRALVSKAFTIKRVNALRPRIQAIADELLDRVQAQGQMDLIDDYAFPLPVTVIAELLGVPAADQDKFRMWSNALIETQRTVEEQEAFQQHMMAFIYYVGQLFAERREHPQDDLITALIQAEEAGERLSHEELFSMVLILLVAGHETTVNLIGNGVLALMKHPEQMRLLQNDWGLMDTAVSEILRYDGPAERATTRWAAKDTVFCGQQIKRKDPIIVILGAANHDPTMFSEPESFDILRDSSNSLAFGYGIHYCVGAPLARLEGEIAIRTLLQRLPDIHLARPETELEWRASTILRGLKHMPVVWGCDA